MTRRVIAFVGSRPEAIKMAPILKAMEDDPELEPVIVTMTRHRHTLTPVFELFELQPQIMLELVHEEIRQSEVTAQLLVAFERVIEEQDPDSVLVLGDTATPLAGALAAYYQQVAVAHVEAGLRTGNKLAPFPEEIHRQLVARIAELHFAPTARARANLLAEGIPPERVEVTGNTVVDALRWVSRQTPHLRGLPPEELLGQNAAQAPPTPEACEALARVRAGERRMILITAHRRESFGLGFARMCDAFLDLASRYEGDAEIFFVVELAPGVDGAVQHRLAGRSNLHLLPPLDYGPFVHLMSLAYLVLTDSGSIQEEAPGLGKPVLLMRDATSRTEALEAGTVKLVGAHRQRIVQATAELLDRPEVYRRMARASNPYGDGYAAERIVARLGALG